MTPWDWGGGLSKKSVLPLFLYLLLLLGPRTGTRMEPVSFPPYMTSGLTSGKTSSKISRYQFWFPLPAMTSGHDFWLWLLVLTSGLTSNHDFRLLLLVWFPVWLSVKFQYQFWFWIPFITSSLTSGITSSTTSGYGKGPADHVRHGTERFLLYPNEL